MALSSSKVLFVFLDTAALARQRVFLEEVLGLEVIEYEYHPPHSRHGVVKYDAGECVLALNIADPGFDRAAWAGQTMIFAASPMREAKVYAGLQVHGYGAPARQGGAFADGDGHRYALRRASAAPWPGEEPRASLCELQLAVEDVAQSADFYGRVLGLVALEQGASVASFATGNLRLVLYDWRLEAARAPARRQGSLIVFHTPGIEAAYEALAGRGLEFQGRVGYSDIGGSVRFADPSGHVFCLYEPSPESFGWASGAKVSSIISDERAPLLWDTVGEVQ